MSIFNSDLKAEQIRSVLKDVKKSVRFVGILGSGMYPLARLLSNRGYKVSGYDAAAHPDTYVDPCGIEISNRIRERNCGVGLTVYSLAIDGAHPEITLARTEGIPLVSRAQLLGALMSEYGTRVAVSGSHGKSTVTALIDRILCESEREHTSLSGASLTSGNSLYDGAGDIFVAEACEYKDSFLRLSPTHQIITSVELDHTDYFPDLASVRSSFLLAAHRADTLIIGQDCPVAASIADEIRQNNGEKTHTVLTYGTDPASDYRICDVRVRGDKTDFSVVGEGMRFNLSTSLIGRFNLSNIAAAVATADALGIPGEAIERAVGAFLPIDRRLTLIAESEKLKVYYDYAHHPTEIGAVISALSERYGSVVAIFRPHTYSRTRSLWQGFVDELGKADFTVILDIYPAREEPIEGISSHRLSMDIPNAVYADSGSAARIACEHAESVIVLLGAGEVEDVKNDLIKLVKNAGHTPERR